MSERFPIGAQVQVKNDGHGSQYRSESERVGEFAGTVVAVNGPKYTGIPEVCVESVTGERRVILVGDLEEGVAATETPEVTEYSVKIWYRSGAYEGAPHCLEDLARKIYADAVKSPGVEFAELHGPSGVLVESKVPADDRDAVSDTLVMRPSPEWRPVLVTETLIRRCCFCQGDKQVHHHTALAMPVCHDCAVFVSA